MFDKLLFFLYDNEGSEYVEITEFLKATFSEPTESVYKHIRQSLLVLVNRQLIHTEKTIFKNLGNMLTIPGKMDGSQELFDFNLHERRPDLDLLFIITIDGRKYIEEKKRGTKQDEVLERQTTSIEQSNAQNKLVGQSVIDTNKLSVKNYGSQKNLAKLTLLVAALSFFALCIYTYYTKKLLDASKTSITKEQLQQLDTTLQDNRRTLDSILRAQTMIDSLLLIEVKKDSLNH